MTAINITGAIAGGPRSLASARTNHWIIAAAIAALMVGSMLSLVIERGVRVEK